MSSKISKLDTPLAGVVHRPNVATVRQTVVVFLATSTAWQRWLRGDDGGDFPGNVHRPNVATVRQTVGVFLATSTAWQRWLRVSGYDGGRWGLIKFMRDEFDCPPLGSGGYDGNDGGGFPGVVHRLAAVATMGMTVGVFLVLSTAWQRWLRGMTVEVFLVLSTAWQRVATGGGGYGGYGLSGRLELVNEERVRRDVFFG